MLWVNSFPVWCDLTGCTGVGLGETQRHRRSEFCIIQDLQFWICWTHRWFEEQQFLFPNNLNGGKVSNSNNKIPDPIRECRVNGHNKSAALPVFHLYTGINLQPEPVGKTWWLYTSSDILLLMTSSSQSFDRETHFNYNTASPWTCYIDKPMNVNHKKWLWVTVDKCDARDCPYKSFGHLDMTSQIRAELHKFPGLANKYLWRPQFPPFFFSSRLLRNCCLGGGGGENQSWDIGADT